jgi:hypothetical protein
MDLPFFGVGWTDLAITMNRIAAGALVAVPAGAGPDSLDALILGLMTRPVA